MTARRDVGAAGTAEHQPVYVGMPYPAYESRCSCGETFVAATPRDSSDLLARHREKKRTDLSHTPTEGGMAR